MRQKPKNKTYLSLVIATLGLAALLPATSHAFTGLNRSTSTAVATLSGIGSVAFSITLNDLATNSTTTQLHWDGVTLPASWVRGNAYITLFSTVSATGGGIEIYTDNKASDASPAFTGTGDPAGLVDTTVTTNRLPMAWSVKQTTSPNVSDPDIPPTATEPNGCATSAPHACEWNYLLDRNTSSFTDGTTISEVELGGQGAQFSEFTFAPFSSPVYVYPQVFFQAAVSPRSYRTTTLRIEAFTQ